MNRIGLVEDNLDYREEVAFTLRLAAFEIAFECDGRDIDAQLVRTPCDLLLLDWSLPQEDGLTIARRVRVKWPAIGIVMLTARGDMKDRVSGLRDGADAYLVKPVDFRELIATLHSLQRRLREPSVTPSAAWILRKDQLLLDSPEGVSSVLTPSEVQLLTALALHAPQAASRDSLIRALGYSPWDFDSRRLELAMSRLRRKLQAQGAPPSLIRAVRNQGYLFAATIQVRE